VRIISRRTIKDFWENHRDAEEPLKAWFDEAEKAEWRSFNDLKSHFGSCSLVGNNRVVFNIKGNKYRLIAKMLFGKGKGYIRFIGTHKEYDKINAKTI